LERLKLTLNDKVLEVQADSNLLQVCLDSGVYIPHLCYHPDLVPTGKCGLCAVEIAGQNDLQAACDIRLKGELTVRTDTARVKAAQRRAIEEILAIHPAECGSCVKYLNCELQSLKQYFGIDQLSLPRRPRLFAVDDRNPLFIIDPNKCVLCERCVRACRDLRDIGVWSKKQKGDQFYIGTENDLPLAQSGCRFCGACAEVCPTGAILDKDEAARGSMRKKALYPCQSQCPAEIDVAGYLRFIRASDFTSAEALIREKAPFPGLLGYVCDHPCETACRRGQMNQPIAIRDLKCLAVKKSGYQVDLACRPASGRKVAVIGSGPAGLTAAFYLAKLGHQVEVFEKEERAGGMPRLAIPRFRLSEAVLDKELAWMPRLGIPIHTGSEIKALDTLFTAGFEAILLATGTQRGSRLSIPGSKKPAVVVGLDFLKQINRGIIPPVGSNVLVLGGGSVAFDCARSALRLGAAKVRLSCLESRDNMPAAAEDIEAGFAEGIEIMAGRSFLNILGDANGVTALECVEVESLSFDENRVPQFEILPGSQHNIETDYIIFAIGQRPDLPETLGLSQTPAGFVEVDSYNLAASREGVFAAGDVVNGPSSVVKAIASGRKASSSIDRYLGGDGNLDAVLAPRSEPNARLGRDDQFASLDRVKPDCQTSGKLAGRPVAGCVYPVAEGLAEARRCLQCDLRLKIKAVKFWSSY
jgi:formate dehydrogenase (NADP+) beta subunit